MRGGAEAPPRCCMPQRGLDIGQHEGGGTVGHQRAVGALERAGDERVLVAGVAAELEAEILAQLRIGIVDAIGVVLRGDRGERVRLVAMALEVGLRDLAEDAGEAALDRLAPPGGSSPEQGPAISGPTAPPPASPRSMRRADVRRLWPRSARRPACTAAVRWRRRRTPIAGRKRKPGSLRRAELAKSGPSSHCRNGRGRLDRCRRVDGGVVIALRRLDDQASTPRPSSLPKARRSSR